MICYRRNYSFDKSTARTSNGMPSRLWVSQFRVILPCLQFIAHLSFIGYELSSPSLFYFKKKLSRCDGTLLPAWSRSSNLHAPIRRRPLITYVFTYDWLFENDLVSDIRWASDSNIRNFFSKGVSFNYSLKSAGVVTLYHRHWLMLSNQRWLFRRWLSSE